MCFYMTERAPKGIISGGPVKYIRNRRETLMKNRTMMLLITIAAVLSLAACSPRIYGTVQLVRPDKTPVTTESPEGTVINMINTSVSLEEASHSVTADAEGKYESEKKAIKKGTHKVEASRIGYVTVTETVEVGGMSSRKVDMQLIKIEEGRRRSIKRSRSDKDKIINPGEVNIQPPMM